MKNGATASKAAPHEEPNLLEALQKLKRQKKGLLIAVGGCMAQEEGKAKILREKFPFIDIIFGTHNLPALGEMIERKKRLFAEE